MYYLPGLGNLYRVTSVSTIWPNPVRGHGAYYLSKRGNRYSRPDQLTVYCSEDPIVAITEGAYYQAMEWHRRMAYSRINALAYPLVSEHILWAFQINPLPSLVDLENNLAIARFGYQPHILLNPSQEYTATQELADEVRTYVPPAGSTATRPEGTKAPSIRTPRSGSFQPHQLCLFVRDMVGVPPYDKRSTLVAKLRIEFEFLAITPIAGPVDYNSVIIDWGHPRVRLTEIMGEPSISPVPPYSGNPGSQPLDLNQWHQSISIQF